MQEKHIHELWDTGCFTASPFCCVHGEEIIIHNKGVYNESSGPDFSGGHITLDGEEWIGNIEIHIRSSDWNRHNHSNDPAYNNVVLHVVWWYDEQVILSNGRVLPTLEMATLQFENSKILKFENSLRKIPGSECALIAANEQFFESHNFRMREALARRLKRKADAMRAQLKNCNGDWNELLYRQLMQYCGMKANNDPFQWLSQITPLRLIHEFRDDAHLAEALLFGQAGMLEENVQLSLTDDCAYYCLLQNEYAHMARCHSLTSMNRIAWKYMRLRPNNFPDVRISQLARLFTGHEDLYECMIGVREIGELRKLLESQASEYWDTHYRFHISSRRYPKIFGEQMLNGLIINVIVPLKYMHDAMIDEVLALNIAEEMLSLLPPEKNAVVEKFAKKYKIKMENAGISQSILELST